MKKLIALMLSIFTILLMSTSAFAFSGGGISGGVNGDGDFTGGGFSGGSRLSSVFGSSPPASSSLSTMLSYEALNNLTANINLGISLGEIEILDGNIQAVTVTKRTDWNAYVITGVYNGNTYVIVNASGGRYYSPINEGYTISAIAGATGYCLTDRPAGTTGNGYLGDLLVTQDNLTTIHGIVDGLGGVADYYMVLRIVNGEYRYYIMCTYPNRQQYFVCNTSGQLFYALRDEVTDDGGDTGGGSTFDPTEVITAINSVYDAVNFMSSNLGSRLANILNATNGISVSVENLAANVVTGFTGVQEQLSTLNSYFTDLSGLFPVQETITLLGSDTRVALDSADRITNVTAAGFNNGDLTIKTNRGPLIDESGYKKVTLSSDTTEYRLYNDANGYRRIVADNEYKDYVSSTPSGTFFYFPFNGSLSSNVGSLSLSYSGTPKYADGISGQAFVYDGTTYLRSPKVSNYFSGNHNTFTFSFWINLKSYPTGTYVCSFDIGDTSTYGESITVSVNSAGDVTYTKNSSAGDFSYTGGSINFNEWTHIAFCAKSGTLYGFINGNLDFSRSSNTYVQPSGITRFGFSKAPSGSMLDEVILVDNNCLWTSDFDPYTDAVFSVLAKDYFLSCTDQTIGLVFDDTINKTLSPTDVNGNAITMGRLEDDFSEIYMDISTMMWYCHDPQTQTEILLSSANQQIMNDTIYVRQNYTMLPADQITADALQNLLPVDSPVYLDMPEGAKLTITYDHYTGWFRMMYILMDKQNQLLSDLDIVNDTIINVENTVIDITNSNPAYNVFYITKTDGTTESVGDAAKDAAVFVGDVLSMFYRLVFDDALDNVGILNDFEGAYSNTEVSVW